MCNDEEMKLRKLRVNVNVEIIDDSDYWIVADHSNSRYLKIKRNDLMDYVLRGAMKGISYEALYNQLRSSDKDKRDLIKIMQCLLSNNVVQKVEYPDYTLCDQINDGGYCAEFAYNNRFEHELEALSSYESNKISRFDLFEMLRKGKVTIIGAGGVGSNVAVLLAAAGIGEIRLIDSDVVEESNLVRQVFYKEDDCKYCKKITALKTFISEFTSYTHVDECDAYIRNENDAKLYLGDTDIIIQTADTPRGIINRIVSKFSEKSGIVSIYCANGTVGPLYIPGETASFEDFEKFANYESGGLYEALVNAKRYESSRVAPSEPGGPWISSYYLYKEVFHYFIDKTELRTKDAIVKISNDGYKIETIQFMEVLRNIDRAVYS